MRDNSHILLSYKLDHKEELQQISPDKISKALKDKNLAWVHLDANNEITRDWLEKEINYLDHFVLDALFADGTRPRILEVGEGVLINLRGVNLNADSDPEDMVSLRIWIDQSRIITIQRRDVKAVKDIQERINNQKSPKNAGDFLCLLLNRLFVRIEDFLINLDEKTDDIETEIIDNPTQKLRENIVNIRRQAIIFRRYMAPQKEVISALKNNNIKWLDIHHIRSLQENHDDIIRYIEDLDMIRERAHIIKDELANIFTDRLNKNTYILSVIAAIFLPLGFLTGLLGVNIAGMPGTENEAAFYIFTLIITFIVLLQIYLFKKFKWF
jgi:zinc transporter